MPFTPNPLLDLAPGIGQRAEGIIFNLVDSDGLPAGSIHPEAGSVRISFDGSANITRTMSGLNLTATEWADVDPFSMRVAPFWKLEDGTLWPLGRFFFTGAPQTTGIIETTTLYDAGMVLDTGSIQAYGVNAGGDISDAMVGVLNILAIRDYVVDDAGVVASVPIGWPIGTSWLSILRALCDLAGFLPPHTDNLGRVVLRRTDPVEISQASITYGAQSPKVKRASTSLNPNLLAAPNVHVVIDSGATTSPITAIAYVDPALPWSKENRGFIVSQTHDMQGIDSTDQAQQMANGFASVDPNSFEELGFTSVPDPRHDAFEVIDYNGIAYREVAWSLDCRPGGDHVHRCVRSGIGAR